MPFVAPDNELVQEPQGGGFVAPESELVQEASAPPAAQPSLGREDTGFPLWPTAQGREFLTESAAAVPQAAADFAREQAGITATHYRNLANYLPFSPLGQQGMGLVREPTPEEQEAYVGEVANAAGMLFGGGIGRLIGRPISEGAKFIGRGFRSRGEVDELLAASRRAIPAGQPATASVPGEVAKAGLVTGTIDAAPEVTPFGDVASERTEEAVGAGAGGTYLATRGAKELLLGNPRFRDVVMRSGGNVGTMVGVLAGYMAARNLAPSAENIDEALDWLTGAQEQGQ